MMFIVDKTVTMIAGDDGFVMEIERDGITFEAWVYHNGIGIKQLMFGIANISRDEFEELAINNFESYKESYKRTYMSGTEDGEEYNDD